MQKILVKNNEFEEWSDDSYIKTVIYDKDNKKIELKGINNSLIIDQSNNRKPSDKLKLKFVKWYIEEKGVKICPYCGKNYLTYFCNDLECKNIISGFDIEHFFPKNYVDFTGNKPYAQLAKNLYNWHLSCIICNQRLKKDRDPLYGTNENNKIFHSYFGWIYRNIRPGKYIPYIVDYLLSFYRIDGYYRDDICIEDKTFDEEVTFYGNEENDIKNRKQVFTTHHGKFFRLGEIYLNDQETFNIFQFIYDKYTQIKDEYSRFKENSKSVEEFVDYFLKNYYPEEEQEILKYSNGKLKKDLIENMKNILEDELE